MLYLILRILHKRYSWYRIERAVHKLQTANNTRTRENPLDNQYQWP